MTIGNNHEENKINQDNERKYSSQDDNNIGFEINED